MMASHYLHMDVKDTVKVQQSATSETYWIEMGDVTILFKSKEARSAFINELQRQDNMGERIVEDDFNGWRNRETWAFHLWMTNTETMYNELRGKSAMELLQWYDDESDSLKEEEDSEFVRMLLDSFDESRIDWDAISESLSD